MNFDKILSNFKDYHLPICIGMFLVGTVMSWFHHLDMAYVAYTGTILGAITGHAFSGAGAPDKPADPPAPPAP
jgi:flagellar biosynthesis protein FliR